VGADSGDPPAAVGASVPQPASHAQSARDQDQRNAVFIETPSARSDDPL
jgi:hypothetical protein